MQNVSPDSPAVNPKLDKVNGQHDIANLSSTPHSTSNSSPAKSETETYSEHRRYMSDTSESEEDSVSEVDPFMIDQEFEEDTDTQVAAAKFLLNPEEDRAVDPETQARLEALLQAAGISQLAAKDGKHLADPEVLRRLTSSVSCALDEAAAALSRMRSDNPRTQPEKISLVEACTDGDVGTVRKLLTEGRSVHETSEEGESLLSLACSAGYYELAQQVLLAMHANVEDRGIKGECTPLMEAASAGHLEIVKLLVKHGADVNAQSTSGNTPLMYGCAGGHTEVVKFLLENGANVEDHNENGHTPLMEAASAGHVGLAKILLSHGAGINTHSNEFKESALTLACYKGHLEMVRFLLEAGADQEHKTDEMHTALMEASMDGHVEVARLLLDSGAQVNMPTDSFESPLTLAACGGHVDLAMLLIERGANIEEVNDEGYTPLMEAAREGHEEMVHLLLGQGANINAQTDETQETALTLACCGGFTEVADILLKGGADIELGASTPLMEAAQEGHLDLVKFLLESGANVHAQTQTGDTALTYACENGHTDVADYLLQYGADLEHESEGGRTPLMKACRAGHLCTVQFLISKGADVRRQTTNNDHTPLSLACAGGHLAVVELLLSHNADPCHKLKDNSTMLIEAAKGGHTPVVQLLLDYPHSMQQVMMNQQQQQQGATTATNLSMLPGQVGSRDSPLPPGAIPPNLPPQPINFFQSPGAVLQEVPEAVRIVSQDDTTNPALDVSKQQVSSAETQSDSLECSPNFRKSLLTKSRSSGAVFDGTLTSAEAQQVRTQPLPLSDFEEDAMEFLNKDEPNTCPPPIASTSETITTATVVPTAVGLPSSSTPQQYVAPQQQLLTMPQQQVLGISSQVVQPTPCSHPPVQTGHHCQTPCTQHQQQVVQAAHPQQVSSHQVQAATQTQTTANEVKKAGKVVDKCGKKGRAGRNHQMSNVPGNNFQQNQNYPADTSNTAITQYNGASQQCATALPCLDVDSKTDSNHDTALTLACAGGHEELVKLLLNRGADIEHRDKKGFTPLILAATAGHEKVVEVLLDHSADIEAQSERTKDTPLSLACSGGRYEVVELLLTRNANKEHRNVSDYTPLSLAASGGYVNIIKLLLSHGAEINSRTGSKLGISPLMLAAMNGHTAAVKLLLDMGSDINAQIETNRNTALTLACFQGRHEVVSLLLDRKANVEHRAKTGLTPLMEAASGGYVEVGRVLLDKGADVNATPVPSSRDTALTIAADKGHVRFVELLLFRSAAVEVKNKKGNSPLWLAANGGHLAVVELLHNMKGEIDSQDNRKVSCLMAAFRKGHVKVVKWMVNHVTQYPSDQEMIRYISTVSDKELLEKCQECVKIIRAAKETQAAKANKNASNLLEELDQEKNREETKRLAAQRRRERKKKKKMEKKEVKRKLLEENKKNENYDDKDKSTEDEKAEEDDNLQDVHTDPAIRHADAADKEEGDSGIDANSQGSCSSNDIKPNDKRKNKKSKKTNSKNASPSNKAGSSKEESSDKRSDRTSDSKNKNVQQQHNAGKSLVFDATKSPAERDDFEATGNENYVSGKSKKSHGGGESGEGVQVKGGSSTSPKQSNKREEGWKEVVRKSSVQAVSTSESGVKKVSVPLNAISRVIGRGGSNINAIRGATGAHIEVEKQSKGQGERIITIKGAPDVTKQAHTLIATLIKDPDVDILQMLPKPSKATISTTTLWDKTQIGTKKVAGKVSTVPPSSAPAAVVPQKAVQAVAPPAAVPPSRSSTTTVKVRGTLPAIISRVTAPRLVAQAEKNAAAAQAAAIRSAGVAHTSSTSSTGRIATKMIPTTVSQTFAAKLSETSASQPAVSVSHGGGATGKSRNLGPPPSAGPVSPQSVPHAVTNAHSSPKHSRPAPTASAPPNMQHYQSPGKGPVFGASNPANVSVPVSESGRSTTPIVAAGPSSQEDVQSEYSLFFSNTDKSMWRRDNESQKTVNFAAVTGGANAQSVMQPKFIDTYQESTPIVDVSKAPGYRGGNVCSPVSSKTSSNSTTPPNIASSSYQVYPEPAKAQPLLPIGSNVGRPQVSQNNPSDMTSSNHFYSEMFKTGSTNIPHGNMLNMTATNAHLLQSTYHNPSLKNLNYPPNQQQGNIPIVSMSRLNPKAPDFSSSMYNTIPAPKNPSHIYTDFPVSNQNTNPIYSGGGKSGVNSSYHRNVIGSQEQWSAATLMQLQQPLTLQQSEMLSGMATGMTLQNIARATGSEIMENGSDMRPIVTHSPNMSPNLPNVHNMHAAEALHFDDRKQPPQPIGTERTRKSYPNADEVGGGSWMYNEVKGQSARWPANIPDNYPMSRQGQAVYTDEMIIDSYPPGVQLDGPRNYPNGPTTMHQFMLQQQAINNVRPHDFMATDTLKMELPSWDPVRPNMNDIQEAKTHVRRH